MAVPVIGPVAGQRVVSVPGRERRVLGEHADQCDELDGQDGPVAAFGLAFQVAFELTGLFNLPRSGRFAVRRA